MREHNLEHEVLSATDIRSKWPIFNVRDDKVGVWDQSSGFLTPEICIETMVDRAVANGAELLRGSAVKDWREENEEFVVTLDDEGGMEYKAKLGVLSVGSWAQELCGSLVKNLLHIERRVLFWFKPKSGISSFDDIPVYIWQYDTGNGTQGSAF